MTLCFTAPCTNILTYLVIVHTVRTTHVEHTLTHTHMTDICTCNADSFSPFPFGRICFVLLS